MIGIVESRMAPWEIPQHDFVWHTCQIRQARSYYGEHVRFHGGYRIEVNRGKLSIKIILTYEEVVDKTLIRGRTAIVEYCYSCLIGRRTVGCCAHTMTLVLWHLGWARHQQHISAPAGFRDEILIREDEDEE